MEDLEGWVEKESSIQFVPIIYGAPHAIAIHPEKKHIGNDHHKRFGDHFVGEFVRNLKQITGGSYAILWDATCDPNKSEAFNQKTYQEYAPAYADEILDLLPDLKEFGFAFMRDAYPDHLGLYVEIHVAGQPNVSRDLRIQHDVEITTGQEKFQDFAHWVASGIIKHLLFLL